MRLNERATSAGDGFGHTAPNEHCDCGHDFDDPRCNWHFNRCPAYAATEKRVRAHWDDLRSRGLLREFPVGAVEPPPELLRCRVCQLPLTPKEWDLAHDVEGTDERVHFECCVHCQNAIEGET